MGWSSLRDGFFNLMGSSDDGNASAGSIAPAALSYYGSHRQNAAQKKMANRQMAFQEHMSNTAYQRATSDMRSAGINPMLAYMNGGASSPSGAMAPQVNELGGVVSSAMDYKRTSAEIRNIKMTNRKIASDTALNDALVAKAKADTDISQSNAKIVKAAIPAAQNRERVEKGGLGKYGAYFQKFAGFFK